MEILDPTLLAYTPTLFDLLAKIAGAVLTGLIARRLGNPPPARPEISRPAKRRPRKKSRR